MTNIFDETLVGIGIGPTTNHFEEHQQLVAELQVETTADQVPEVTVSYQAEFSKLVGTIGSLIQNATDWIRKNSEMITKWEGKMQFPTFLNKIKVTAGSVRTIGIDIPTNTPHILNTVLGHARSGGGTPSVNYEKVHGPPEARKEMSLDVILGSLKDELYKLTEDNQVSKLVGTIGSLIQNVTGWVVKVSEMIPKWEGKIQFPTSLNKIKVTVGPVRTIGIDIPTNTPHILNTGLGHTSSIGVTSSVNDEKVHGPPEARKEVSVDVILGSLKDELYKLRDDVQSQVQSLPTLIKSASEKFSQWVSSADNLRTRRRVKKLPVTPEVLSTSEVIPEVDAIKLPPVEPRVLLPPKLGSAVGSSIHIYVPPPSFASVDYKIHLILGVIVVFFICCYASLVVGRKQQSKIIPGPYLLDGFYAYIIAVRTGFRWNASTKKKVKLQLFSNSSSSPEYFLSAHGSGQKVLTRGKEDMFLVYTKVPLGELTHIFVTLDGQGAKGKWYLESVSVSDLQVDKQWYFANNKLLKSNDDGSPRTHNLGLTSVGHAYSLMWSSLLRTVHHYHRWIYTAFGGGQEHSKVLSRPVTLFLLFSAVGNFFLGNVLVETTLQTIGSHQLALHFTRDTFFVSFLVNLLICIGNVIFEAVLGFVKSKKFSVDIFLRSFNTSKDCSTSPQSSCPSHTRCDVKIEDEEIQHGIKSMCIVRRSRSDTATIEMANKNSNNNTSNSSSASDVSDDENRQQDNQGTIGAQASAAEREPQETPEAAGNQLSDYLSHLPPITPDSILFDEVPLPKGLMFAEVPLPKDGSIDNILLPQGVVLETIPMQLMENPTRKKQKPRRQPIIRKRQSKKNKNERKAKETHGKGHCQVEEQSDAAASSDTVIDQEMTQEEFVPQKGQMVILAQSDLDAGLERQCMVCKRPMESKCPYPYHWVCKYARAVQIRRANPPVNGIDATLKQEVDALYSFMRLPNPAVINKSVLTFPKKRYIDLNAKEQEFWQKEICKINPMWVDEKLDEVSPPKQEKQVVSEQPSVNASKTSILTQEQIDAGVKRDCLICKKPMVDPYPIHWYCKYEKAVKLGRASPPANQTEATIRDTVIALCKFMDNSTEMEHVKSSEVIKKDSHMQFPDVKVADLPLEEQIFWNSKLLDINPLWAAEHATHLQTTDGIAAKSESATEMLGCQDTSTEEKPNEKQSSKSKMTSEMATAVVQASRAWQKNNISQKFDGHQTTFAAVEKVAEFINGLIGDMVNTLLGDKGKTAAADKHRAWQSKVFDFFTTYQKSLFPVGTQLTAEVGGTKPECQKEETHQNTPKMSHPGKLSSSSFGRRGMPPVFKRLRLEMTHQIISENLPDQKNWDDVSDTLQLNVTGECSKQKDAKVHAEAVAQTGSSRIGVQSPHEEDHLDRTEPQMIKQEIVAKAGKFDCAPQQVKAGYVYGRRVTNLSAAASVKHLKQIISQVKQMSMKRQDSSLATLTKCLTTDNQSLTAKQAPKKHLNTAADTKSKLMLGELISKIITDDKDPSLIISKGLPMIPEEITIEAVRDLTQGTIHGLLASFYDMRGIVTKHCLQTMEEFTKKLVESVLQVISTKLDADKQRSHEPARNMLTTTDDISFTHTLVEQAGQIVSRELVEIRDYHFQILTEAFTYHYLDTLLFNIIIRAQHAVLQEVGVHVLNQECQDKEQVISMAQELLERDVTAFFGGSWNECKVDVRLGLLTQTKEGDLVVKEQDLKESIMRHAQTVAHDVTSAVLKKAVYEVKMKTAAKSIVQEVLAKATLQFEVERKELHQNVDAISSQELAIDLVASGNVMLIEQAPENSELPKKEQLTEMEGISAADITSVIEELKKCRNLLHNFAEFDVTSTENRFLELLPKKSRSLDLVIDSDKTIPINRLSTSGPALCNLVDEMPGIKDTACTPLPAYQSLPNDTVIQITLDQDEDVTTNTSDVIIQVDPEEDYGHKIADQSTEKSRPLTEKELLHAELLVKGELRKPLPHWMKYIVFVLVFCSIVVSFFFTSVYGMSFEDESLTHWLLLNVLSIAEDIFIFQPIKCIIIYSYFLLFRRRHRINNPV